MLLADGVAVALCGFAAGAGRAVRAALRMAVPLVVLMTVVNALTYHRGDTILIRGWDVPVIGSTDVTLEALVAGAAIGMRIVVVIMAFAVYSACVDPDRVLRALRPLARRSTLTAALVSRLVPVAASDLAGMREASALRGPAAAPAGRGPVLRRLVESSMDRAIDVAATMELRGHSLPGRAVPSRIRTSPSGLLVFTTVLVALAAGMALVGGAGGFDPVPSIEMDAGPETLALCVVLPAAGFAAVRARRCSVTVRPGLRVGPVADSVLSCEGLRYRYPSAGGAEALAGRRASRSSAASWLSCVALRGRARRLCFAPPPGSCRTSTVVRSRGAWRSPAGTCASTDPPSWRRSSGSSPRSRRPRWSARPWAPRSNCRSSCAGSRRAPGRRSVEEVSLALGIADLLERTTDTLSGGELQRVALAAALVTRPRLVLLDEPTSALDPVAGDELIGLLRRLNEEWGVTILLGEHRIERCLGAADRVVAMDGGAVSFDGDPRRFLEWALRERVSLATPAARLLGSAGIPPEPSVREARRALARAGMSTDEIGIDRPSDETPASPARGRRKRGSALSARNLWVELGERAELIEALRGVDLDIDRGERVALMGRNGAGKSTLLRAAAGLAEPRRGSIDAPAGVALLPQRTGDLMIRDRIADELPGEDGAAALRVFGLEGKAQADPRDLSGGERQRLALAIVSAGRGAGSGEPPGAVLLDEPTRGMDRERKDDLSALCGRALGPRRRSRRRDPRRRVRRRVRRPRDPPRSRRAGRRRHDRRAARGRLVLLDRDGADPGRTRRDAGAGGTPARGRGGALVTWQLASFGLLVIVIVAGFAWYERRRPPAQVVALVAALAALAVAGRIVFSPIPNVVPTTDIVLIAGYALGGGPGFVVGALSALVSNFWLGQGPWTPWQMAGWGMCGVLGAGLAKISGREIGRLPLAIACAFAGLAYGMLLDFSLMVTYGGEQSLDRFLAISARGVPFNVAHAAGNFTLALIAGPALIRMLRRYRERFEFAWGRGALAGAACAAAALVLANGLAGPQSSGAGEPEDAVDWLRVVQNDDGGFGTGPGEPSSPQMTGWAVLGLEAAGVSPDSVRSGSKTPITYLRSTAGEITTTGDIERTILVLDAAGVDPRSFGGRDLVKRLLARRSGNGSFGSQVNGTAFGVLALSAAGAGRNRGSAAWLRGVQNGDGGWGFAPGAASDADSTGAALQALSAAGGSRASISRGVAWLRGAQQPGGAFNLAGGPVNSQSTAWAVQGLVAAGKAPSKFRTGGRSGLDYLSSVQAADGHYRYSKAYDQTPVWVTGQALQAASLQALPLRVVSPPVKKNAGDKAGGGGATAAPAPAPAPPAGSGGAAGPGSEIPLPKPAPAPPVFPEGDAPDTFVPPEDVPDLDPEAPDAEGTEESADDGGDGGPDAAMIGSIVLVAVVVLGGAWLLRRQDVPR